MIEKLRSACGALLRLAAEYAFVTFCLCLMVTVPVSAMFVRDPSSSYAMTGLAVMLAAVVTLAIVVVGDATDGRD